MSADGCGDELERLFSIAGKREACRDLGCLSGGCGTGISGG